MAGRPKRRARRAARDNTATRPNAHHPLFGSTVCMRCGKRPVNPDYPEYPDVTQMELYGHYGSTYPPDLTAIQLLVCGPCLQKWVADFKHPPKSQRVLDPRFRSLYAKSAGHNPRAARRNSSIFPKTFEPVSGLEQLSWAEEAEKNPARIRKSSKIRRRAMKNPSLLKWSRTRFGDWSAQSTSGRNCSYLVWNAKEPLLTARTSGWMLDVVNPAPSQLTAARAHPGYQGESDGLVQLGDISSFERAKMVAQVLDDGPLQALARAGD